MYMKVNADKTHLHDQNIAPVHSLQQITSISPPIKILACQMMVVPCEGNKNKQ